MAIALKKLRLRSAHCAYFRCGQQLFRVDRESLTTTTPAKLAALVDQALQFPEVRQIKVDDMRRGLARGRYRLDANAVAQAMLREGCDIARRRVPIRAPLTTVSWKGQVPAKGRGRGYRTTRPATSDVLKQLVQDLNKKIGVIMAHAELMNLDGQLDSIHRMHLQVIRREAVRLHKVLAHRLERDLAWTSGDDEK